MPTPVKNAFPVVTSSAASPVKAGRGVVADGAGESFRNELVRRRGCDRAKTEATKPQAAKAEPKRAPKARKSVRGGRGEPRRETEEPEIRADPSEGTAVDNANPAEAETLETTDNSDAEVTVTDSPNGKDPDAVDPADAAAVAPLVAAAASAPVDGTVAPVDGGEVLDADAVTAGRVPLRPAVYHADGATDVTGAGEATGTEDAAPAAGGGVTALFAGESEGAAGEGATSNEQEGALPDRSDQLPGEADSAGVPTCDEVQPTAGFEPHATAGNSASQDGTAAEAVVSAGAAEARPEVRPGRGAPPPTARSAPAAPPEVRFASANHETIVTSMRGELMPHGGTLRIRLDPPQLGALQVTVQIQDGVVTASFETSNDEATRLLGHSLNQLKSVLESHGVAVDKLQVQQTPRESQTSQAHDDGRREQGNPSQEQEQQARQEQQRREMLRRMWRRLSGGRDPLDLTA